MSEFCDRKRRADDFFHRDPFAVDHRDRQIREEESLLCNVHVIAFTSAQQSIDPIGPAPTLPPNGMTFRWEGPYIRPERLKVP